MPARHDFRIIRKLRHKRGLTLEELAEVSGLSYPTVASIETNKAFPSLRTIDAIADALEIPTGRLISLAGRRKALPHKTESLTAKILSDLGINLKKVNITNYNGLRIFRAIAEHDSVANSTKLHDDCNCHELCYCLSGSIDIKVQNETHRLYSDSVILFDSALDHEYTVASETEYLVIHIPKESARVESLFEGTVT